ncbi:sulfatase-like hydrolase/transferase [Falsiroseomonas sp. E2-1-a20]|uniref:sulfatase-like hydrolase/transferase n=1 Tax=Falsiroseomonas sp. E2-1-a20 TaxID=3239300 RepID=UPI003F35FC17
MSIRPANLLFILSDEHSPKALGRAGHPFVHTPNLDALAASGTRFSAASTPCPICVPARAALATGRPLHEMGRYFDNADAYDGGVRSWHHALRDAGHDVVSIGKLHFRGLPGDDHGFSAEKLAMHIVDGKGDLLGLIRDQGSPPRKGASKMSAAAGPGESDYTRYDRDIAAAAQTWLHEEAPRREKPWCLFVSLVTPHFPLTAPPEHFYRYASQPMPMPKLYGHEERPNHPFLADYAATVPYDSHVQDEATVQRMMAGYYGLVSFMDEQVGKILHCLEECGLSGTTRVLYTSDHGDNVGARGLWGKSTMYEESVGVPMILAGEGVPAGHVSGAPVSLTDIYATALDAVGVTEAPPGNSLSLFDVARGEVPADRMVLSEYHATGSREAAFMLRDTRFKYVRYVSYPAQLFDLRSDPEELQDLAQDPAHADTVAAMEAYLRETLDPAAVDRLVKARQHDILEANGGREAVLGRGDLPFSPPPGVRPAWS